MTTSPRSSSSRTSLSFPLAVLAIAGSALTSACWDVEVQGDRAMSGACPVSTCSSETPEGLVFVGAGFWDESVPHLGPIVAGGQFKLGLRQPSGLPLPRYRIQVDDPAVLTATIGKGEFVSSSFAYESGGEYLLVSAGRAGATRLRIVDASTGELFDQLTLAVDQVREVTLRNVREPDRHHLYAGTEETLGIRLLIEGMEWEHRAVDQSLALRSSGEVQPDPMYWDCFSFRTPKGVTEVTFEAIVGGRPYTFVVPVK